MKTTYKFIKAIVIMMMLIVLMPSESSASHFRYGNITWTYVTGRTVTFHISQSWRRTFYPGPPNVGNIVNTEVFNFGDGTTATIALQVTAVNTTEDWFYGECTLTHTYAGAATNFTAFWNNCCRISTLQEGNNDQNYLVQSIVTLSPNPPHNNSPISAMPPIVNLATGLAGATFTLAASDPDAGDVLNYRLSTNAESQLPVTSAGTTVHPSTGVVTFSTIGKPVGALYSRQFMITDNHGATTPVDLLIRIVQQSNPPQYNYAITPANGTVYQLQPGNQICFNVNAFDNDPGDNVTLSAVGLPPGVVLVPLLPASGNPVQTSFCWTPTIAQLGARVVNFTAQDIIGSQTNTSVTIIVSLDPVFDVPPTLADGYFNCIPTGVPFSTVIQAHAPDPLMNLQITAANAAPPSAGITFTPGIPTMLGNTSSTTMNWTPTAADFGPHVFSFTATDGLGHTTNHSYTLIPNSDPYFTSSQSSISINENEPFLYNITFDDADVPYGDVLDLHGIVIPSWMTFAQTGPNTGTLSGTPGSANTGLNHVSLELEDTYHHCHGHIEQEFDINVIPCNVSVSIAADYCTGNNTVALSASSSTAISYVWSSGELVASIAANAAGPYTVTAYDVFGCSATADVTISDPTSLSAAETHSDVTCFGYSNGSIDLTSSGGTQPHSYTWSNGSNTEDQSGLAGGSYSVTVTDANGCTAAVSVYINEPLPLAGFATAPPILCNGDEVCIDVTASGGTTPYFGTGNFCGYHADTYTFTVTDSKGCTSDVIIIINEPSKVTASATPTAATCAGNDGMALAAAGGGTPPYDYRWTPGGQTNAQATSLTPDIYNVLVTDANGCTASANATVASSGTPPGALGAISGPGGICRGQCATYSVTPDPNVNSYAWTLPNGLVGTSSGPSITICATAYCGNVTGFISVRGVNGCGQGPSTNKTFKLITEKPKTPSSISGPTTICRGGCATYTIAAVTGAAGYTWIGTGGLSISSGQGTTSVVVCASANASVCAQLKVYASNCKGNSSVKYKNITVQSLPSQPGSISGYSSVCKSHTKSYSIGYCNGASGYTWSATNGAVIYSGQGTSTVNVKFNGATSSSTVISVVATNSCGTSAPRTKTVTINNCRTSDGSLADESTDVTLSSLNAYPNPTSGNVMIDFTSSQDAKFTMKIIDVTGRVMLIETISAIEGANTKAINLESLARGLYYISLNNEGMEPRNISVIVK